VFDFGKIKLFCLVCETPPTRQVFSSLSATDLSGQFLAGDTLDYDCNGALVPDNPAAVTRTCTDPGAGMAMWMPTTAATPLPTCSK